MKSKVKVGLPSSLKNFTLEEIKIFEIFYYAQYSRNITLLAILPCFDISLTLFKLVGKLGKYFAFSPLQQHFLN